MFICFCSSTFVIPPGRLHSAFLSLITALTLHAFSCCFENVNKFWQRWRCWFIYSWDFITETGKKLENSWENLAFKPSFYLNFVQVVVVSKDSWSCKISLDNLSVQCNGAWSEKSAEPTWKFKNESNKVMDASM